MDVFKEYDKIRRIVELNTWIRLSCFILIPLFFSFAFYNTVDFVNADNIIMTILASLIVGLVPITWCGIKNYINKIKIYTKYFPLIHTINIKPWDVDALHKILKCHEFDDVIETYKKIKSIISMSSLTVWSSVTA